MWGISKEFGDAGMALQDAFTVVVSTEVVATVIGTKLTVAVVLGQPTVDVIFTVTDVNRVT